MAFATQINEKFDVVVGWAKPPYVFKEEHRGYEIELVEYLLSAMGKKAHFIYVPFGRSSKMLASDGVDAIMTVNNSVIPDVAKLSFPYIHYQNVVISLKKNNIKISDMADIGKYTVASFQNAHKILGVEFENAVAASPMYLQVADQERQTSLLFHDKVDLLVMDINIFNYLSLSLGQENPMELVDVHFMFPKSAYQMAFKDIKLIAEFNDKLNQFFSSDAYKQLKDKYQLRQ